MCHIKYVEELRMKKRVLVAAYNALTTINTRPTTQQRLLEQIRLVDAEINTYHHPRH